jgi:pimeloyl-ACP methyl ester carboxylesterase/predicted glycosyltransferase
MLDRDGLKVGFEVWGTGGPAVLLAPAWMVSESRMWKAQVPFLARHFRVITVDPRGNGRSDRPQDAAFYREVDIADDLVAAMDEVGVDKAVAVALSRGVWYATLAAHRHPGRIIGLFALNPTVRDLITEGPDYRGHLFDASLAEWSRRTDSLEPDYATFMAGFYARAFLEPHSTKQIEDGVGYSRQTEARTLLAAECGERAFPERADRERLVAALRFPVVVVHGSADRISPPRLGRRFAELSGGRFIEMAGAGHLPGCRFPVPINRWIKDFITEVYGVKPAPPMRWSRPLDRPRKVLYVSSPIGLGHARRDQAIVAELRKLRPEVGVDWLAQDPVTAVLRERGERIHPASAHLASESGHWESESDDHDLHAFQALRRMDEILVHNFMVFTEVVAADDYSLWVGDEAWEMDYFLHENPELKRAAYTWLTDFVGLLPMARGAAAEAELTADYNAEMLEHIARFPRLRDGALFVGEPADIVPDSFGAGLPEIRAWTEQHYRFPGYITGIDPDDIADRAALRAEFGWRPDERVCLIAIGGTAVGEGLLRKVIGAHREIRRRVPGLRLVAVTGPRLDPARLPRIPGVDLHAYLPKLYRYLAACDVALVQGGLTTTMELVAARRPFVYVPLRNHFEQQFHVPHRLARYGAGRRLDYADADPDSIAEAIAAELDKPITYLPVDGGGAARAAAVLAEQF